MASRRKRRPRGVGTTQQERMNSELAAMEGPEQQLTPEEIQAAEIAEDEAERDPAEEARIAEEDAALERAEQAAREGEDLPAEGYGPGPTEGEPDSLPEGYAGIADDATEHWIGAVEPEFDQTIFERGDLAAGIRMFTAMLNEARAGFIEAAIGQLEEIIEEDFTPPESQFLATVAAEQKTETGLPDVAAAYRALVRARAAQEG